ncbi:sulfotransferase family 2 domain-containing protein [Bacillus cereus]|uniref:sulfotransferase family 2 domain-containing protein n=1 Tax=Bacillus cereus TaxID=1396 RepID=UPI00065C0C44|nr:sulfotransferase family 2 domain-containing protein [Bacillus cereus]KMP40726.1 RNA methyltransferase [Bacillus cereus]PEZ33369.1 RNA methyltransferase [Bacillus cereus]PFM48195.1 RNA methyltransferase [Bacillus cereus]PGZ65401.1 RNA methyltransferase [Bacillus cereus]
MTNSNIYDFIMKYARGPHFHQEFPIILFWSQKSGCTSLAHWFFYQINLFKEAIKYNPFIHNYEFDIYKNSVYYFTGLANALSTNEKPTYKLVRNPYKRAVSSFLSLITPPNIEHPEWQPIRQFLYHDKNCNKKISFKLFLYYLKSHMNNLDDVNPHYVQQYIQDEEKFVTNYIHLENFSSEISNLEKIYGLKKSPLDILTKSWHHQSGITIFKGNYADADITDPLFPRLPTYESFYDSETIQLVEDIFKKDFTVYKYSLTPL